MNQVDILGLLELLSIVISTTLVVLGMTTVTKTSNGKLTRWGIAVLVGVIIANAFSFSRSYIKQKQDQISRIHALEEGRKKDSTEKVNYANQINLLFANISKSDSSLQQQFRIQEQTEHVLHGMSQSITMQKGIFTQSDLLNQQQKNSLKEIHRTLNPIFPFRISLLELSIQQDNSFGKSNPVLNDLNKELLAIINKNQVDSTKGLSRSYLRSDEAIDVNKDSRFYKKYLSFIDKLYISFSLQKEVKGDDPERYIDFFPLLPFMKDSSLYHDFHILFSPKDTVTTFLLWDLPIQITSDKNFVSIDDTDDSKFKFSVLHVPGRIIASTIRFNFPPDYTTRKDIDALTGTNEKDSEKPEYDYSFQLHFKEEKPKVYKGPVIIPNHR